MYGIVTYIYQKNPPNAGKYTIHGWYGYYFFGSHFKAPKSTWVTSYLDVAFSFNHWAVEVFEKQEKPWGCTHLPKVPEPWKSNHQFFIGWLRNQPFFFSRGLSSSKRNHHFLVVVDFQGDWRRYIYKVGWAYDRHKWSYGVPINGAPIL